MKIRGFFCLAFVLGLLHSSYGALHWGSPQQIDENVTHFDQCYTSQAGWTFVYCKNEEIWLAQTQNNSAMGVPRRILSQKTANEVAIASASSGKLMISGIDGGPATVDHFIWTSSSTDHGATWSEPVYVQSDVPFRGIQEYLNVDIAAIGPDSWMVVYSGYDFGWDFSWQTVIYTRSTDGGESWTPPGAPNFASVPSAPDFGSLVEFAAPKITANEDGQVLLTTRGFWANSYPRFGGLYSTFSSNAGQSWGPLTPHASIGATIYDNQSSVAVADGKWVMALSSETNVLPKIRVSESFDPATVWTNPSPLNSDAPINSEGEWRPELTRAGQTWVAVWKSQLFDSEGTLISAISSDANTWSSSHELPGVDGVISNLRLAGAENGKVVAGYITFDLENQDLPKRLMFNPGAIVNLPDLTIEPYNRSPARNPVFRISNTGKINAKKVMVRFYASDDDSYDSSDKAIGFKYFWQLNKESSKLILAPAAAARYVRQGKRIMAIVDPAMQIAEEDESNNTCYWAPVTE